VLEIAIAPFGGLTPELERAEVRIGYFRARRNSDDATLQMQRIVSVRLTLPPEEPIRRRRIWSRTLIVSRSRDDLSLDRSAVSERHLGRFPRVRVVMGGAAVPAAVVTSVALGASGISLGAVITRPGVAHVAASAARVAGKDHFTGRITAATGALRGRGGQLSVDLNAPPSTAPHRRLALTNHAAGCRNAAHCLELGGTVHGTLSRESGRIPDVGSSFAVRATGKLRPLGTVSATGTVHGTGFIAQGYEQLRLSVMTPHGTLTITARSGLVPGFTSP
jgi:hypothetical protein